MPPSGDGPWVVPGSGPSVVSKINTTWRAFPMPHIHPCSKAHEAGRGVYRSAEISVLLDLPEHGPMCHDAERGRTGRPRIYQMWVGGPAPLARNSTGAGRQNKIYLTYPKADCIPVSAKRNLWSRVTVIRHIQRIAMMLRRVRQKHKSVLDGPQREDRRIGQEGCPRYYP